VDLNQLLFQHQVALLKQGEVACSVAFASARDLVSQYQVRIACLRETLGASAYPDVCGLPAGTCA